MAAFVEALKRPFEASKFPHYNEFSISSYKGPDAGHATELKLLYKPSDHNQLMRVERLVNVHLEECNLGREISATRHSTRDQAPELILASTTDEGAGVEFLQAIAASLPRATPEEIAKATEVAHQTHHHAAVDTSPRTHFAAVHVPNRNLPPAELQKLALTSLAEVMKVGGFASGAEVHLVPGGSMIEVKFPRSPSSLWLGTTYKEAIHIKEVSSACVGVRTDPVLREGWSVIYKFDSKVGCLFLRAISAGSDVPTQWKLVGK